MQDEEKPPQRLGAIIDALSRASEERADAANPPDFARRRTEIDKAATLLVDNYGATAAERARLLERRQPDSAFARSVRLAVEKQIADRNRA